MEKVVLPQFIDKLRLERADDLVELKFEFWVSLLLVDFHFLKNGCIFTLKCSARLVEKH